jgi:peptidoglycan/LPS O-acetylase OafA/YrhL
MGNTMSTHRLDRIHSFNLLRVTAFIMVAINHGLFAAYTRPITSRFATGAIGVSTFFVLSGFLITRNLLADCAAGRPLKIFFIRRSLRILPTYFLVLSAYAALWPTLARISGNDFIWAKGPHVSEWLYYANFEHIVNPRGLTIALSPVWSLCIEEHFYLIWPWLVFLLTARQMRSFILLWLPALATASVVYFQWAGSGFGPYFSSTTQFMTLGFGALLAYYESWARSPAARPMAALCLMFAVMGNSASATSLSSGFWSFGIVLLILSSIEPAVATRKIFMPLRSKQAEVLGLMTYSAYLIHLPICLWFQVNDHATSAKAAFAIFALSLTIYLLWEQHWIALGRALTRESRAVDGRAVEPIQLIPADVGN